jgi:hypothetical protein
VTQQIKLTKGKFAIVDDADFEWLNQWQWQAHFQRGLWYARRTEGKFPFRKTIPMHNQIKGTPKGMVTDHKDGNGLNNQRDNLRICTRLQNARNSRKSLQNTSGFKGVTYNKESKKWRARITDNRKQFFLGSFNTPEEAGRAYDEAAKKYHGEFSQTNDI